MPVLPTHGARVSYSRTGTGPPVLLIQGVGAIGDAWRPQINGLRDRFSLIAFDHRGLGASTMTEGTLSIEAMADDARAILDAEGVDRCHVVGHSMGALIGIQLALTCPDRVRSLALLCAFPNGRLGARLTRDTFLTAVRTRIGTRTMRRNAFLSLVLSEAGRRLTDRVWMAKEMADMFGHDLADQPRIMMQQLRAMSRYDPGWRLRCLAAVGTLVVSGKEDRIARPEYGRMLAAAIPGAAYVELDGAAHAVSIESSALINRLLAEHMTHLARSTAS